MWKVRIAIGWLACAGLACASDGPERERVDIMQTDDPSTVGNGDEPEMPVQLADAGRGGRPIYNEGVRMGGSARSNDAAAPPLTPTPGVNPPVALSDGGANLPVNPPGALADAGAPVLPPPGVFGGDAGSGPSAGNDAGSGLYGCNTNLDCAIRNVGNCCGYYPRCVNVNATITPPNCNGQAGVCGFPAIDSCECRQNRCVSLQAGVQQ